MASADNVRNNKAMQESYLLELLEPRIMLSADPFGAAEVAVDLLLGEQDEAAYEVNAPAKAASPELDPLDIASVTALFASQDPLSDNLHTNLQPEDGTFVSMLENDTARIELIIIDSAVSDQQHLLQKIIPTDSHINYQIHYLDQNSEGINQVSELLNQYSQIDAVHILSHGKSDGVQLGSAWVDADSLQQKADQIAQWSSVLTDGADILIYGCDVTSSDAGIDFIQTLQRLSGADVAASDDTTGAESLGGDWELEFAAGTIETNILKDTAVQQWAETLALPPAGFLITTDTVVSPSGANGLDSWTSNDLISLSDPNLTLGASSNGTLSLFQNLSALASDGSLAIDGLHFVSTNLTLGSGAASADLLQGDVLFSVANSETINGVSITDSDVVLFRPDVPGDYSSGTTQLLLDNLTTTGTDLEDFALVEKSMTVAGGASLNVGDIIYNVDGALFDQNIYYVSISAVGEGATVKNSPTLLVDGSAINVSGAIGGVELVNYTHDVGGETLNEGELLISFDSDQTSVGKTPLPSVSQNDIVTLTGVNSSDIYLKNIFDGSDIGLNNAQESYDALALVPKNYAPTIENNSLSVSQGEVVTVFSTDLSATDLDSDDELLTFNVSTVQNGYFAWTIDPTNPISSFTQGKITANEVVFVHEGGELTSSYKVNVSDGVRSSALGSAAISFSSTTSGALWLGIQSNEGASNGIQGLDGSNISRGDILQQADPNFAMGEGATNGTFSTAFDVSLFSSQDDTIGLHYVSSNITVGGASSVALQAGDVLLSSKNSMTFNSNGTLAPSAVTIDKGDVYYFRPDSAGDYSKGNFYLLVSDILGGNAEVRAISLVERDVIVGDYTLQAGDLLFSQAGGSEDNDVRFLRTSAIDLGASGAFSADTYILIEGDDTGIGLDKQVFGLDILESDLTIGGQSYDAGTLLVALKDDDSALGNTPISVTKHDVIALNVSQTTLGSGSTQAEASILFDGGDVNFDSGNEGLDGFSLTFGLSSTNTAPTLTTNDFVLSEGSTTTITGVMLGATDADDSDSGLVFNISLVAGGQFELASDTGVAVTTFTQNQITLADVVFVDNGDEMAPAFSLSVSDGVNSTAAIAASINFTNVNDVPGGNVTITSDGTPAENETLSVT
ncbi:MAG: DUF4347 domain-containing protein, partial [Pseudomonadales bacterium]